MTPRGAARSPLLVPSTGPDDWRKLLAAPDKQWRAGFSAHALAHCWEQAGGFPSEVSRVFAQSGIPSLQQLELLLAIPEYRVALPGGARPSQTDLFVLGKGADGQLVALTVEGKVSEPFGPTLSQWHPASSAGKRKRLDSIQDLLGLDDALPHIRYQLLHRTASAVLTARRFNAASAVMLVHSFSKDGAWFEDFAAFGRLFGVEPHAGRLYCLRQLPHTCLYTAWVQGKLE